jgi:hypothetical protein
MTNYEQQLKLKERHLEQKVFQVRILFTSKDEWSRERVWDELFEEKVTKEEISRSKRPCLHLKKKTRSFSSIQ